MRRRSFVPRRLWIADDRLSRILPEIIRRRRCRLPRSQLLQEVPQRSRPSRFAMAANARARNGPANRDRNRRARRRGPETSSPVPDAQPRRFHWRGTLRAAATVRTRRETSKRRPTLLCRCHEGRFWTDRAFAAIITIIMRASWAGATWCPRGTYNVAFMAGRPALQGRESGQVRKEAATAN